MNGFQSVTVFAKSSISDIDQSSEYASAIFSNFCKDTLISEFNVQLHMLQKSSFSGPEHIFL